MIMQLTVIAAVSTVITAGVIFIALQGIKRESVTLKSKTPPAERPNKR